MNLFLNNCEGSRSTRLQRFVGCYFSYFREYLKQLLKAQNSTLFPWIIGTSIVGHFCVICYTVSALCYFRVKRLKRGQQSFFFLHFAPMFNAKNKMQIIFLHEYNCQVQCHERDCPMAPGIQ